MPCNSIKSRLLQITALSVCLVGLSACSTVKRPGKLSADVGYVNVEEMPVGGKSINPIRRKALQEVASTLGARGALAWRSLQINRVLEREVGYLNHIFDFNQLLLKNNVLPPILTQSSNELQIDGDNTIRFSGKIYKIIAPSRFVTSPPTWRSYLWMHFKKPDFPSRTLLPRTRAEALAWNAYLKAGWKRGLLQADEIFGVNLSHLKRDYSGMMLYRELLAKKMINAPFVASSKMGITGNTHELHIDDRIARITGHAELQPDAQQWHPVFIKKRTR